MVKIGGVLMPVSEAQRRAISKYDSKTYKKVMIRLKLDDLERLHDHIKERGESLNGFVNRAIDNQVKRDKAVSAFTVQPEAKEEIAT